MKASAAYSGVYATILENYAITPGQIVRDAVFVTLADDVLVGFYSLTFDGEPELELAARPNYSNHQDQLLA